MARKSKLNEAADTVKSIAGAALGAAAIAATGVVVTRVAGAIRQGGKQLEDRTPDLQQKAAQAVTSPLLPRRQKRAAAARKAKSSTRKVAARKAAKKRSAPRRKR